MLTFFGWLYKVFAVTIIFFICVLTRGTLYGEYSYLYAEVNREYSVDMTLELYHDSNGDGIFSDDEQLYKHEPDELQWWITGFDPLVQNVKAEDLQAVTTIDFSSFGENKDIMLDSFREFNAGEVEWDIPEKDSSSYIVTLTW